MQGPRPPERAAVDAAPDRDGSDRHNGSLPASNRRCMVERPGPRPPITKGRRRHHIGHITGRRHGPMSEFCAFVAFLVRPSPVSHTAVQLLLSSHRNSVSFRHIRRRCEEIRACHHACGNHVRMKSLTAAASAAVAAATGAAMARSRLGFNDVSLLDMASHTYTTPRATTVRPPRPPTARWRTYPTRVVSRPHRRGSTARPVHGRSSNRICRRKSSSDCLIDNVPRERWRDTSDKTTVTRRCIYRHISRDIALAVGGLTPRLRAHLHCRSVCRPAGRFITSLTATPLLAAVHAASGCSVPSHASERRRRFTATPPPRAPLSGRMSGVCDATSKCQLSADDVSSSSSRAKTTTTVDGTQRDVSQLSVAVNRITSVQRSFLPSTVCNHPTPRPSPFPLFSSPRVAAAAATASHRLIPSPLLIRSFVSTYG